MSDYLHNHKNFRDLLRIVGAELNIEPGLIEKDYWIMHVLYGLKQQGFQFELKGGTSLSKGYGIIHRFSEDIDIHIKPPSEMEINENPNNNKPRNIQKRKDFYDGLADEIKINGIIAVKRDETFDDLRQYRSGGIRLHYESIMETIEGVKEGILLEVGFDTVTPNNPLTISSWAYEKAIQQKVDIIDNRAVDIACYHIGYTFVEKLQTIATKFRQEQEDKEERQNLMRQYYDVYSLLQDNTVKAFIGTEEYQKHKEARFPPKDYEIPITD
jgi:predicted nucleotidyltransferase component of viral defense system